MIEIEKKFILKPGDGERLVDGADLVAVGEHEDVYYDTPDFSLSRRDRWLRRRNGAFNLKVPVHIGPLRLRLVDQYEDVEDEAEIRARLGLPSDGSLEESLSDAEYKPVARFALTRRTYRRDPFVIDLDALDFGYETAEVECFVWKKEEMDDAITRVLELARTLNLALSPVPGKHIEYIRRTNPAHYRILVDAGVV